jgi:glucose 1-dehydrogenase
VGESTKAVLVTGAGRGIGQGCARVLNRCRYLVVANDTDYDLFLGQVIPLRADVFTREGIQFVADCIAQLPMWGVICNPYKSVQKPFLEFALTEFEEVLNAVLVSHCFIAQAAAKRMIELGRGGRIIFIGSVYGTLLNRRNSAPYDAGKAALEEFTRVLALELAPHRITVNCIAPGFTDTPGERKFASEEQIVETGKKMPLGRACTPVDIGHAAAFLMSEEAAMITGITLPVTAGMHLKDPYGE